MTSGSCLYVGSVFHRRLGPRPHRFRYRLFWLLLDLDEIGALDGRLRLFSHNRFNLFSLFDRDHGDRRGAPLRAQAEALLAARGVDIGGGAIRLLCMPRTLGYDFNPLSVYFCHRPDGALAALIYEVHNTFGERHSYVLPAEARQGCDKAFFVSPFLPMGLRYEFQTAPPAETIVLSIQAIGPDGPALQAGLSGERRNLVDRQLLRVAIKIPFVALKATLAIHWEAARLLAKGVAYLGRKRPNAGPASDSPTLGRR
ncbi:MAG: DUF1365 family protein [Roseiarcus sp.]